MKYQVLGATLALMLLLAALPNVSAGTVSITEVTYTPEKPKEGDTIHVKAKVTSTDTLSYVRAYPCWEKPTYMCGIPVEMTDADKNSFFEANLSNAEWTTGNIVHITIKALDSASANNSYVIPPITIGGGSGLPEEYKTESDCKAANFYWWDDSCHAAAKGVSDYKNMTSCENAGYFWWDSKCNSDKGTPDKYGNETSCKKVGYFWYSDKCNEKKKPSDGGIIPGFEAIIVLTVLMVLGLVFLNGRTHRRKK